MKFLNRLSRKSPEAKLREKLLAIQLPSDSVLFTELFPKTDLSLIQNVVGDLVTEGKLKGAFIGNKGWFLFNSNIKIEKVWDQLQNGVVDLEKISKDWGGFGNKRVFMALESYGLDKKHKKPIFKRVESKLYLNSFLLQEWTDGVNRYDIEEGDVTFDKILSSLNPQYRDQVSELARRSMGEPNSDILLGSDNIIRRRSMIPAILTEYIQSEFERSPGLELRYSDMANVYGISEENVSKLILTLIDEKELENITNYPIDGFIKSR